MRTQDQLLQTKFLNALRKENVQVALYLLSGVKLVGHIESFDPYLIMLKSTVTQVVYKHAISTIVPARPVRIPHDPVDKKLL